MNRSMPMEPRHDVHRYGQPKWDIERCLSLAALCLLFLMILSGCGKKEVTAQAAPPEVEVIDVTQQDVPIYGEWIATLDGFVNAQIQPQVTGYLTKQNYLE